MGLPVSKKELDRLGDRLRDAAVPSEEDLRLWGLVRPHFLVALEEVRTGLAAMGLQPTAREKNRDTLVDKLRRERDMRLSRVQDVVGARVVIATDLAGQDAWVARIAACFPDHRVRDRRREPSHGYRAVHLVARVEGLPVEIQVRTEWQDRWAQAMERLGDCWGRAIRYGGGPESPDRPEVIGVRPARPRREWVDLLLELPRDVAATEERAGFASPGQPAEPDSAELARLLDDIRAFTPRGPLP
jgi:hypothetical protein